MANPELPERLSVYFHSETEDVSVGDAIPMERGLPDIIRIKGPVPAFAHAVPSPRRRRNGRLRLQGMVRPFMVYTARVGHA